MRIVMNQESASLLLEPDLPKQSPADVVSNGRVNALRAEDAPVHDWYRFVLSFPPHLVRWYAQKFGLGHDSVLLDPFCGTGTTLVEAKKNGIPSIGVEAIPMSAFAARTKLDWSCDPNRLVEHAESVAQYALERFEQEGISDSQVIAPVSHHEDIVSLSQEQRHLLFKNAMSPLPLKKSMILIDALDKLYSVDVANHEQLALASTLVHSASNLKFGPEVGVGKIKQDAEVVSSWLGRVSKIASDLRAVDDHSAISAVHLGDAREIDNVLEPCSIDAVITSPPYPNEKDYTRTVRLESVLLGFMKSRADLRDVKEDLLRSNTRGVFSTDTDSQWLDADSEVRDIASRIEARRIELGKTSGFERRYAKVTLEYFGGMTRHLRALTKVLRPGARLAYVVGDQASYFRIMIRTGKLLAEIAEREGYEVEGLELFRTRFATATGQRLNEEVLLLRWPS